MPQLKGSIPWNKGKGINPIEMFWKKTKKTNYCWEWLGEKRTGGYGYLFVNNKYVRAHRFSFNLHKGKIPKGIFVCHTCDNPGCVNPDHLWLGTAKDNAIDKVNKNRQQDMAGEKNPEHKLTWEDVNNIRNSKEIKQKYLAKKFNVSESLISGILNNKRWIKK